ncbi:MAG: dTDP-4-dehydrorhamnose 3,5-epimerase [Phycisphaerales bacterium]|nr:dTDP-4-dehydrorhamnose 3,5-epimerase [Phycisphaerales bacterium]
MRPLEIPDLKLIEPQVFGDERGFFLETWSREKFHKDNLDLDFVQDNLSRSMKGVLRGLHYQVRHTQGKLVRCTVGEVLDVAVDLRKSSPTFGRWCGVVLSEENKRSLWIPPGFAHGFLVRSEHADFQYKCTDIYSPEHERTIMWNDPDLAIDWQFPQGMTPVLGEKDQVGTAFRDAEVFE